mgnify:CR=1 FL=1
MLIRKMDIKFDSCASTAFAQNNNNPKERYEIQNLERVSTSFQLNNAGKRCPAMSARENMKWKEFQTQRTPAKVIRRIHISSEGKIAG